MGALRPLTEWTAHWRATAQGVVLGGILLVLTWPAAVQSGSLTPPAWSATLGTQAPAADAASTTGSRTADFGAVEPTPDARLIADWVASSGDNQGRGFVIVDKATTRLMVFDSAARLQASSTVLIGAATGDDTVPGIGDRPIALVRPEERTTPAGRFLAERGHNARGEDVVWVDYAAAVSMHRVITSNAAERRLERLASPKVSEHRISYGCINVPTAFYETELWPLFARQPAVVYVLPDVRPLAEVFAGYAAANAQLTAQAPPSSPPQP